MKTVLNNGTECVEQFETLDDKFCVERTRRSFTLIELMVVMIVIAVLAGIAYPVISRARYRALENRALSEIRLIRAALKDYQSDYGKWPGTTNWGLITGVWSNDGCYVSNNYLIVGPLLQPTNVNNPRGKVYLRVQSDSVSTNTSCLLDPWERPYRICLDEDFDGLLFGKAHDNLDRNPVLKNAHYSVYCEWSR